MSGEKKMRTMVAVAPCYVNERLYKPGEEFEYDGPEGQAFHVKGGKPIPPVSMEYIIHRQADAEEVNKALSERDKLRRQNEDLGKRLQVAQQSAGQFQALKAENDDLKARIEELEEKLKDAQKTPPIHRA